MNYEINVSRDGNHLFATHPRSLSGVFEQTAIQLAEELKMKFPDCKVTLTKWVSYQESVDY